MPPNILNRGSPKIKKIIKKAKAPKQDIYKECHNNFSALGLSAAPRLLAIEDVTAPPRAPNAIC